MVCCAFLAILIGSFFWAKNQFGLSKSGAHTSAVSWRLDDALNIDDVPNNEQTINQEFSIAARLKSFSYAFNGIKTLIHGEHNAWLHLASTLVIITMAFALKITASDWRWIILSIALVWFAEAFNTAIERLCNVVSRDFHEGIKASKDLAAGAVLICAIFAAVIGIVTLTPYLISPNEVPAFFDDICRTFL